MNTKYLPLGLLVLLLVITGYLLFSSNQQKSDITQTPVNTTDAPADVPATKNEASSNKLNLSNQQLQKVPEYVFKQTDLQELDLSNNKLTGSVQAEIRYLQNLVSLDLSNNMMTGVPAEIGQLQNLQYLNLSNNQLTGLPYELGNLKNLKTFDISGNEYAEQDLKMIQQSLPSDTEIIK